ncbi:uncharacterized protein LOC111243622 isoform X2 [Varroa destructor]|uniref:Uncharacterized protein n=1 Tax=Varroa destructor TaxID=109461 RepID=A0A7M7J2J2_VARDE|nr:uncharacterized protein LOC111243622 isoform X2 [Varroa destructor]
MSEMLVVRWPEHSVELRRTFTGMRDLGELLDVTLVTPDGEVEAHRLVLAASSELLRALLRKTATTYGPCSLVFRDLNIGQLELVLDFIYRGELAVDRTQFELLARACDYLQIKASLITEVVDQRVFEEEESEVVPYDAVPANQGGHVVGNKRRMSQGAAAEIQNMEHVESHALDVNDEFQVIELVEESRPSSSGATTGYSTRRNRQEYAKRAKLTTVGDKKIFSLDEQAPTRGADEKPVKRICRECSLVFNYLSDYKEHRRQVHSLQCNHCNFRATKSSAVRDHFEKVHQNVRRFSCTECEFQCKDRATLYNHIRRHTNEKPYGCAYCDYKAAQSASMKQHVALHENIESRPHRCDECTRYPISFASRSALTKHKKAHHSGEKGQKQQPLVMSLEIFKDAAGDSDDVVSKVDAGPTGVAVHAENQQEESAGCPLVNRASAQGTRAGLIGISPSVDRRMRVSAGNLEQLAIDEEGHHPEEEMESEEVVHQGARVDAASSSSRTIVPVAADHDDNDEEAIDDEEEDGVDEEDVDDVDAEEEEPARRTTPTSSAGVKRGRASPIATQVRATARPNVQGHVVAATTVTTSTIAGPRQVPDNSPVHYHAPSNVAIRHGSTVTVNDTGNSGTHQHHHPSDQPQQQQQQHIQHPQLHLSVAPDVHTGQTGATHNVLGQAIVSSSSVIHHPSTVVGPEAVVVPGGSLNTGLSVPTNVASVTMVTASNHNNTADRANRSQDDLGAHASLPTAVNVHDRVVMTSEATIPVHMVGEIVAGASTTTGSVGGQMGPMGLVGQPMDYHTSSSGATDETSPIIVGGAQIDAATKDRPSGTHIVGVPGSDAMQLHAMM